MGQQKPPMSKAKAKGELVERIAAMFHEEAGVILTRNARLRPRSGKGRTREIDILLESVIAGYPVRIAIECKNEGKPIGAPYIDQFKGKLDYLGIPYQHGVFISASEYTSSAQEVAAEFGIRLLLLTGLTRDGLNVAVSEAFKSVIYLMLSIESFQTIHESPLTPIFYDNDGRFRGMVFDLIWRQWRDSKISADLGERTIVIDVPDGWHNVVNGKRIDETEWTATVRVVGLVLNIPGKQTKHALMNAQDGDVEKLRINVDFDQEHPITIPVIEVTTEDELTEALPEAETKIVIGRLKLPRIRGGGRFGLMYWPPSERSMGKLAEWASLYGMNDPVDPMTVNAFSIEGDDLSRIFEQPWDAYPGHKD